MQNADGCKDLRLSKAKMKSKCGLWLLKEFVTKGKMLRAVLPGALGYDCAVTDIQSLEC